MSDPRSCERCGSVLAEGDELCPRCLLELGRETAEPKANESSPRVRRPKRRTVPTLAEIAARFPELEMIALIGEGGMGAVYKARQAKIDRLVALKVLALDPGDDPTFAERFRREARVLARLDHPRIVKLYDFGKREGLFYLVLEFVDGANLRTLMKQALLEPKQALAIVPQMCEALQFAHDEGVVHRDIKPENVLIDAKGRVKIADFGLAKLADADLGDVSLTEIGQVMGTPHYMAPEQMRGSRDVDHRADIYSLGVVFYEMLTGELPRGNFELPSKRMEVDVRLDEIVLKSLERTPERRYQHAVEVKTDVEGVGSGGARTAAVAGVAIGRVHGRRSGHAAVVVHPNKPWEFFLTFLLLWPLVGLAFNGGAWWLTGAMALVAATFWSQVERSILARPELAAALKAESPGVKAARHFAALTLLALGLFSLFAAQVSLFGILAPDYRAGPDDPDAMRAVETRVLPALLPPLSLEERVPEKGVAYRPGVLSSLDRERMWRPGLLLLLAPLLLAGASFVLGGKRPDPSAPRDWRQVLLPPATFLGSLIVLEASCSILGAMRVQAPFSPVLSAGQAQSLAPDPARGPDDFENRLRIALLEQDYTVTASGSWSVENTQVNSALYWWPTGAAVMKSGPYEMRILFAEPASVFDRWHVSWSGPRREWPHAVFVLRTPLGDGATLVRCDLGQLRAQSGERREWSNWLSRTLAAAN